MKYKNELKEGVVVPVKNGNMPVSHISFLPGVVKEIPAHAMDAAEKLGLTLVESSPSLVPETKVIEPETKKAPTKKETKKEN